MLVLLTFTGLLMASLAIALLYIMKDPKTDTGN